METLTNIGILFAFFLLLIAMSIIKEKWTH
jgi:hypothetical protein